MSPFRMDCRKLHDFEGTKGKADDERKTHRLSRAENVICGKIEVTPFYQRHVYSEHPSSIGQFQHE